MKVTSQEVKGILPSGFKLILDPEFTCPTDEQILEFSADFVEKRGEFNYQASKNDCDNAAWVMVSAASGKGWAFALAIIEGHALCLYINDNKELKYIEPQTGEIVKQNKRLKVTVMP